MDRARHRLAAELSAIQLKIGVMLYHPEHHPQSHNHVLIHLVLHSSLSPPVGTAPTMEFLSLPPLHLFWMAKEVTVLIPTSSPFPDHGMVLPFGSSTAWDRWCQPWGDPNSQVWRDETAWYVSAGEFLNEGDPPWTLFLFVCIC